MINLKEIRKKTGKSQVEVARDLGISQQNYSRYENGQHEPDNAMLATLADYFHTTIDYIVGHDVPYLINKSQYSEKQLVIFDKISKLDNNQCERVISYIDGLSDGKIDNLKPR